MKNRLYLTALLAFCLSTQSTLATQSLRLSEPVLSNSTSETFGEIHNPDIPRVTINDLLNKPDSHIGKPFQLSTKIAKVCQKKGCFFIATENQHTIRVAFKDYGFFIPTNSGGKTVVMTGELVQKQMSEEQAAHFNNDLRTTSPTIASGKVYEIIANSITIPVV